MGLDEAVVVLELKIFSDGKMRKSEFVMDSVQDHHAVAY
jgi:hypothetical protein